MALPEVVRLDPFQRLVEFSFGNRLALVYAFASRINESFPPQVLVTLTSPVSLQLIDRDTILEATGLGSSSAPINEDVTGELLRSYRAWRHQSAEVFSAGHADRVGVHCVVALNLAKFSSGASTIDVRVDTAGFAGNFTRPQLALSTYRNVESITLPEEGSGDAVVTGDFVARAIAHRDTEGVITGSIDRKTLAVTLVGDADAPGGGGGEEG